jgi:polyhydroxyalkanoate synthesis repressor PhaR
MVKPAKVIIKKYGNRRLYDTSASRYINLDEIAALVRNGTEVQVVDVTSGEDLTRVTLTQIITENAKDEPAGLPLELLRQLVMASDHVGQEFIMWYLKSAFDTYGKLQTALQGGLSEVQSAAMSPMSMMKKFVQGKAGQEQAQTAAQSEAEGQRKAQPQGQANESELEQLRKRLAELESRMKKKERTPRKRKKTS